MRGLTRIGDLVFTNLTDWFSPPMLHFSFKSVRGVHAISCVWFWSQPSGSMLLSAVSTRWHNLSETEAAYFCKPESLDSTQFDISISGYAIGESSANIVVRALDVAPLQHFYFYIGTPGCGFPTPSISCSGLKAF